MTNRIHIHAIECNRTRSGHTIYWRFFRVGTGAGPDCTPHDITRDVASLLHYLGVTARGQIPLPVSINWRDMERKLTKLYHASVIITTMEP